MSRKSLCLVDQVLVDALMPRVAVSDWQPAWHETHRRKTAYIQGKNGGAIALLDTAEWKGSTVEDVLHVFIKSSKGERATKLTHPSGAVCFLRVDKQQEAKAARTNASVSTVA